MNYSLLDFFFAYFHDIVNDMINILFFFFLPQRIKRPMLTDYNVANLSVRESMSTGIINCNTKDSVN